MSDDGVLFLALRLDMEGNGIRGGILPVLYNDEAPNQFIYEHSTGRYFNHNQTPNSLCASPANTTPSSPPLL